MSKMTVNIFYSLKVVEAVELLLKVCCIATLKK